LLKYQELKNTPFLILGNKIDQYGALSEEELKEVFQIETTGKTVLTDKQKSFIQRPVEVFMCSIKEQTGYGEGILWLCNQIKNK
jgi:GTP-binding protein SAR1